jgi:hypothetical protein
VNVEAELDHPLDHLLYVFLCCMVLHCYDHGSLSLYVTKFNTNYFYFF